jgi:hypothetical protein
MIQIDNMCDMINLIIKPITFGYPPLRRFVVGWLWSVENPSTYKGYMYHRNVQKAVRVGTVCSVLSLGK